MNSFTADFVDAQERAESVKNSVEMSVNIGSVLFITSFVLIAISVYQMLRESFNALRARGINTKYDMAGLVLVMLGFLSFIQIQIFRLLPDAGKAGLVGIMKIAGWYWLFSSFFEGLFFFLGFLLIYLGIRKAARAVRAPAPKNLKRVLTTAILVLSFGIIYIAWMFYGIFWVVSTAVSSGLMTFFNNVILYITVLVVIWIGLIIGPLAAAYFVHASVQTVPKKSRTSKENRGRSPSRFRTGYAADRRRRYGLPGAQAT